MISWTPALQNKGKYEGGHARIWQHATRMTFKDDLQDAKHMVTYIICFTFATRTLQKLHKCSPHPHQSGENASRFTCSDWVKSIHPSLSIRSFSHLLHACAYGEVMFFGAHAWQIESHRPSPHNAGCSWQIESRRPSLHSGAKNILNLG